MRYDLVKNFSGTICFTRFIKFPVMPFTLPALAREIDEMTFFNNHFQFSTCVSSLKVILISAIPGLSVYAPITQASGSAIQSAYIKN